MPRQRTNVLLVKYENAWVEVGGQVLPHPTRSEAQIEMSGVRKKSQAVTLAQALIAIWSQPRESIVAQGLPHGEGGPTRFYFEYFEEGNRLEIPDYSVSEFPRVMAVTVTEDSDGQVSVAPELVSHLEVEEARINRILARFASGNADGFGRGGIRPDPIVPARFPRVRELPPFTIAGLLTNVPPSLVDSIPYTPGRTMRLTGVTCSLRIVGTTATTIALLVDGVSSATIVIPANRKTYYQSFAITVPALTSPVQYRMVTGGTGAAGLVVNTHASLT